MINFLSESKQGLASELFDFWSQSLNSLNLIEFLKDILTNKKEREKFKEYCSAEGYPLSTDTRKVTKIIRDIICSWEDYLKAK
jgi:hypothetical protein